MMLLIQSVVPASAQQFYDNVVIVLDASGSMKEKMPGNRMSKMDAAKAAIKAVLQTVPQSTHVGLLVFSASNSKKDWVYPLGSRDDAVLIKAIDEIRPGSNTPLGAYIKQGADRLLEERATQYGYGSYRLLIVTDGEAQDKNLVNRYTPDAMARGITMDVIGVAMSQDHTLATKAHSYRRANDAESLQQAIREVFAEVSATTSDLTQNEAFDLLAPIPTEVASAMIQALSISGNHPLGQSASSPRSSSRSTPPAVQPTSNNRPPVTQTHHTTTRSKSGGFRIMPIIIGVGLGMLLLLFSVAVLVIILVKRTKRRGHR